MGNGMIQDIFSIEPHLAGVIERTKQFVDRLQTGKQQLYVYGRNIYSESVLRVLPVAAVIDDFCLEPNWKGKVVKKLEEVPTGAFVLVCSGGKTQTVLRRVTQAGHYALDYFAFSKYSGLGKFPEMVFNEGFAVDFETNKERYFNTMQMLADETSRTLLQRLVKFRLDHNIANLEGFEDNQAKQYFESFLELSGSGETFLDVGCYDGATSREFAQLYPNYLNIIAFEPDQTNFEKCLRNLANTRNAEVRPYGLGAAFGTIRFNSDGSGSSIASDGDLEIQIRRLDDVLPQYIKPTFIKMDVEGGEGAAIDGATTTIARFKPKLAISVYHRPGDFWSIPDQILKIRSDYKIYLRHYTETIYETVMFFV